MLFDDRGYLRVQVRDAIIELRDIWMQCGKCNVVNGIYEMKNAKEGMRKSARIKKSGRVGKCSVHLHQFYRGEGQQESNLSPRSERSKGYHRPTNEAALYIH
jgi:phage FluMu protein Com